MYRVLNTLLANTKSRGKRSLLGVVDYPFSTRFSTFGPGTYALRVTKLFTGRLDVQQEINVYNDILATNPELGRVSNDFKYFKVNGIFVTFSARNISDVGNLTPAYMMFNLDGQVTENVRLQDNVKTIPPLLLKDKTFKFKLPKLNVYGGLLSEWFKFENLSAFADLVFQLYAPSNTSNWYIRFDIAITLKGPTNISAKEVVNFEDLIEKKRLDNIEHKIDKRNDEKMLKEYEQADHIDMRNKMSALRSKIDLVKSSSYGYDGEYEKVLPASKMTEQFQVGFTLVPNNNTLLCNSTKVSDEE